MVSAARGQPIPAADDIPTEDEPKSTPLVERSDSPGVDLSFNNLTVPMGPRSQSFQSDATSDASPTQTSFAPRSNDMPPSSSDPATFRGRAKTLASLTTSSKNSQPDMMPREMQLPNDPYVNGQRIEAYLYKDASECPICFLYYPPYLNKTRCCDQSICSECFVQIKRPDPHPPEHADPTAPVATNAEATDPEELISEPAGCPFCVQPEFGITYDPPAFRRGWTYVNHASTHPLANKSSAMSSASSLNSAISGRLSSPTGSARRRAASIAANNPSVITTDRVRPDWHRKLAAARAHTARRSAAATALHTAAYVIGNRAPDSSGRQLGPFGRRGLLRRTTGEESAASANSTQLSMMALLSERYAASSAARGEDGQTSMVPGPRGSSRRNRVDDLEDMMMMEAIRLSLASEDDRRKREEKDAKKEAKKKEKENKKAEKAARKAGVYPSSANQSTASFANPFADSNALQADPVQDRKGKAIQQKYSEPTFDFSSASTAEEAPRHLERARVQILPDTPNSLPYSSLPHRPSHLRTLSNASSSASSLEEGSPLDSLKAAPQDQTSSYDVSPNASGVNIPSTIASQDTFISGTPPGGGAGMEPMFNFRSLAAMVGDDEKPKDATHEEHAEGTAINNRHRAESSASATARGSSDTTTAAMQSVPASDKNGPAPASLHPESPELKITPSSQHNSNVTSQPSEDNKHAAMGVENLHHGGAQPAS